VPVVAGDGGGKKGKVPCGGARGGKKKGSRAEVSELAGGFGGKKGIV